MTDDMVGQLFVDRDPRMTVGRTRRVVKVLERMPDGRYRCENVTGYSPGKATILSARTLAHGFKAVVR